VLDSALNQNWVWTSGLRYLFEDYAHFKLEGDGLSIRTAEQVSGAVPWQNGA
jgi:hypothetical protein